MDDTPSVDKLVSVFIKIRDARDAERREWEAKEAEYNEQLDLINAELLEICKDANATSIKTKHGTAIRTVKTRYWTNDWDQFYKFMIENNAPELLEKRIQQTHMKEFLEENPDVLPAGLNVDSQYTITVRRSK
jgi:hypothetical protein